MNPSPRVSSPRAGRGQDRPLARRASVRGVLSLLLVLSLGSGCASRRAVSGEWDPIEPVNRASFAFNDGLDIVLIEPTARGWRFVFREPGLGLWENFFTNLEFPIRFVGNLLQAELGRSGAELGRFTLNTTVGLAGFFDPASYFGIGIYREDVGQAVGVWGVGPGPYLMIPILGPSNGRDFFTGLIDGALLGPAGIARATVGRLNSRAQLIEDIEQAKLASLDYYAFVRNAYVTTRQRAVANIDPSAEPEDVSDDLYDLDELED